MDDSEEDLTKLVHQLARRVQNLELDADVVQTQVQGFKATEATILKSLAAGGKKAPDAADESPVAKLAEEMKALPSRVAERLAEVGGDPFRRRRMRRLHPMMFEELLHMSGEPGDPVAILMAASIVRDELPWLYELAMEVYRAVKSGNPEAIEAGMGRLRHFSEMMMHGPFMHEMGFGDKESHMFAMELPRMLEHMLRRSLEAKKVHRRKPSKAAHAQEPTE